MQFAIGMVKAKLKRLYTSINPPSRKFGTIFFAEISKVCNITENFQLETAK